MLRDAGEEVLNTQVWDDEDRDVALFGGGLTSTFRRAGSSLANGHGGGLIAVRR